MLWDAAAARLAHQFTELAARLRVGLHLARADNPLMGRVAAHGAILSVSAGVLLVSHFPPSSLASHGGRSGGLTELASRVSQGALALAPDPVVNVELTADRETDPASSAGFISTGAVPEADASLLPWDEPQRYVVAEGDTLTTIAAAFGREPETLLFANPGIRSDPHSLSIGDELTILPVDGVLHVVEDGDSLDSLAEKYKAQIKDILGYTPNGLPGSDALLVVGAELVIPGGTMEISIPPMYQSVRSSRVSAQWAPSPNYGGPAVGTGAFHIATYGRYTSRFSRWHPAVDIANSYGTPIYAIDSGVVEVGGWYGPLGYAVVVDHGNGYESVYGHMQSVSVSPGNTVQRGQIIGAMGCSRGAGGRCTGPHLHLEVFYQGRYINPCSVGLCP